MASYAEFLDAAVAAARPRAGTNRKGCMALHRNGGVTLDSQLDLAERIVDKLMSEVGADETSKRLMALARKANAPRHGRPHLDVDGVQPSFAKVTESDDDDDGKKEPALRVPHGFWARFMREELNLRPSDNRRMRLLRAVKQHAVRAHKGCLTRAQGRL